MSETLKFYYLRKYFYSVVKLNAISFFLLRDDVDYVSSFKERRYGRFTLCRQPPFFTTLFFISLYFPVVVFSALLSDECELFAVVASKR